MGRLSQGPRDQIQLLHRITVEAVRSGWIQDVLEGGDSGEREKGEEPQGTLTTPLASTFRNTWIQYSET